MDPLPPTLPEPNSLGALLRCGADGELCEEGCRKLDDHLRATPADQNRLEFEKALKSACGRVMAHAACPEEVRQRVRSMCSCSVVISPLQTREQSFWAGSRVRRAVPALVAAGVLFAGTLFVLNLSRYASGIPSQASIGPVASYVRKEHKRCMRDPAAVAQLTERDPQKAKEALVRLLGHDPTLPRFEEVGLKFVGLGPCGMPSGGNSAHLRFETDGTHGPAGTALSLFIQQVTENSADLEEGEVFLLHPDEEEGESLTMYAWRHGDLLYYLVASDLLSCEKFRAAVGLPEATESR